MAIIYVCTFIMTHYLLVEIQNDSYWLQLWDRSAQLTYMNVGGYAVWLHLV